MTALSVILDIILILISLVLIVAVLMQQGQKQGLGAISGGAETFFGKGMAKGANEKLAKYTKIATVIFIVLAIVTTIVVSHIEKPSINDLLNSYAASEDVMEDEAAAEAEGTEEAAAEAEAPAEADAAVTAENTEAQETLDEEVARTESEENTAA